MFKYFNPNYKMRKGTIDCSVRAVSKALDVSWDEAYLMISTSGYNIGDVMSRNLVWWDVLKEHGFYRQNLPNTCPDCFTVEDFCRKNPIGTYVLGLENHTVTVKNGDWFDTWNCANEIVLYFFTR